MSPARVTVFPCKGTLPPCIASRYDRQIAQLIPARALRAAAAAAGKSIEKVSGTLRIGPLSIDIPYLFLNGYLAKLKGRCNAKRNRFPRPISQSALD
jgi:hypothetical protein